MRTGAARQDFHAIILAIDPRRTLVLVNLVANILSGERPREQALSVFNELKRRNVLRVGAACLAVCGVLIAGCKSNVHYDINHVLRAVKFDRASQTLSVRYEIRERQVWRQRPCFGHGCGDSKELPAQVLDLSWTLPEDETRAAIPHTSFGPHVRMGSRSERLDVSHELTFGDSARRFTKDDRLGPFPVLMYDSYVCWDALPCYDVMSPDARHKLIADKIYSLDTGKPVVDLSGDEAYGAFVESTVEQFSYVPGKLPGRQTSIGYALSNGLRYIVSYPKEIGCLKSPEARQRFSAVLVFDLESRAFETRAVPLADANRHPFGRMQHVYVLDDAIHFVSQYAEVIETDDGPSCRDADRLLDFDVTAGALRQLDRAAYLIGNGTGIDGAANFYTNFVFEEGVIEFIVFDIPSNTRRTYRLALPSEILAQVSPEHVRPGIVPGEFVRH
jgi:hypothetical protein